MEVFAADEPPAERTIIFAGRSGLPPRFIDEGPDRGAGWTEFETFEVRKGMAQDGFKIKMEYMTPARIAHEFRTHTPICTYPIEWNHPEQEFSKTPNRILSIPLNLGGETSRSIVFLKERSQKFDPYVDSKGDLNLRGLLRDRTLKTVLIRDRDYGWINSFLTDIDERGDQVVRPEFQKNIDLRNLHENRQLIEMLRAERFDYLLTDNIEDQDFVDAKIDRSQFKTLIYATSGVKSADDPRLERVSIGCSVSPETLRAMPYFNRWIQMVRGIYWLERKLDYRKKIDTRIGETWFMNSTLQRFRGDIDRGALETWYPLQQRHFAGLRLYPPAQDQDKSAQAFAEASEEKQTSSYRNTPRWVWFSESPNSLTLLDEPSASFTEQDPNKYSTRWAQPYPRMKNRNFFSVTQLTKLAEASLFTGPSAKASLTQLTLPNPQNLRKLTLAAYGLTGEDLEFLRPQLTSPTLEDLTVLGAEPSVSATLLKALPKSLVSLNLTGCSLGSSDVQAITRLPLKKLSLSNTQLTDSQLLDLLNALPPSIEVLSLGYLRTAWNLQTAQSFGRRAWPHLRELDLENSFLFDSHLLEIEKGFPPNLQKLHLGSNRFTPKALQKLFSRPWKSLTELDLTLSRLGSDLPERIVLPPSLKRLWLEECGLTQTNLPNLSGLRHLEELNLSRNALGDAGVLPWISLLGTQVNELNLSRTGIGMPVLKALSQARQTREIENVNLAQNNLGDEEIAQLVQVPFKIRGLDLSGNRIKNGGAETLAQKIIPQLERLNLSDNLLGQIGIASVAQKLSPHLEQLGLQGTVDLAMDSLSQHLPPGLKSLDLSGNLLSDAELELLAPRLPQNLRDLTLSGSGFGFKGTVALAQSMPKRLHSLILISSPMDGRSLEILARHLPSGLESFYTGRGRYLPNTLRILAQHLPQGLRELQIYGASGDATQLIPPLLFENLPRSLEALRLVSLTFPTLAAAAMDQHWPPNVREIIFQGVDLQKKGRIAFLHTPESLERLSIFSGKGEDEDLESIAARPLHNVLILQLYTNLFTGHGLASLLKSAKNCKVLQWVGQNRISKKDNESIRKLPLKKMGTLQMTNLLLPNEVLIDVVKNLPRDFWFLDLSSVGLTLGGVDSLIGALPPNLTELSVSGNNIGQVGFDKFKSYVEKKRRESGFGMKLLY